MKFNISKILFEQAAQTGQTPNPALATTSQANLPKAQAQSPQSAQMQRSSPRDQLKSLVDKIPETNLMAVYNYVNSILQSQQKQTPQQQQSEDEEASEGIPETPAAQPGLEQFSQQMEETPEDVSKFEDEEPTPPAQKSTTGQTPTGVAIPSKIPAAKPPTRNESISYFFFSKDSNKRIK